MHDEGLRPILLFLVDVNDVSYFSRRVHAKHLSNI